MGQLQAMGAILEFIAAGLAGIGAYHAYPDPAGFYLAIAAILGLISATVFQPRRKQLLRSYFEAEQSSSVGRKSFLEGDESPNLQTLDKNL